MMNDEEEESALTKIRGGLVTFGDCTISSFKALGKLGLNFTTGTMNFTTGIVKGAGWYAGSAMHSASLATGLDHVINPSLPLSPMAADKKLSKYSKSYDLGGFMQMAQETSKKLGEIKSVPSTTKDDGTRNLDIFKLGSIGATIKNTATLGGPEEIAKVDGIAAELGDITAEAKLAGPDGLQGKFHALYDEINNINSDTFNTPTQIIAAFKNLHAETSKDLKTQKTAAIERIKTVLEPDDTDDDNLTEKQKNFAALCNIQAAPPLTTLQRKAKIKEKVNELINEVEKEYSKSEKSLNEYFNGTPSTGKDTPAVPGLIQKLEYEKEKSEADLLLRISHLERMLKRGYDISLIDKNSGKGLTTDDEDEDKEHLRASCLKGVTLKRLLEEEKWAGKHWGENKVNTLHTRNGLTLVYETNAEGKISVTGLKIPPQWLLTDSQWEAKVQLALDDYISALKIDQKPGEKLTLTINHPVDTNRNILIQATYRAAIRNGYKPEDIIFTVSGSKDEKGNFTKQPASEVLQKCGLSAEDADSTRYAQEKTDLKKRESSSQTSIQAAVNKLKFDASKKIDEFNPDESDTSHAKPTGRLN